MTSDYRVCLPQIYDPQGFHHDTSVRSLADRSALGHGGWSYLSCTLYCRSVYQASDGGGGWVVRRTGSSGSCGAASIVYTMYVYVHSSTARTEPVGRMITRDPRSLSRVFFCGHSTRCWVLASELPPRKFRADVISDSTDSWERESSNHVDTWLSSTKLARSDRRWAAGRWILSSRPARLASRESPAFRLAAIA